MNSLNFSYCEFISLFQRGTNHEKAKTVLLVTQKSHSLYFFGFGVFGLPDYPATDFVLISPLKSP